MKYLYIMLLFIESTCAFAQSYDTIRIGYSTSVNMIFDSPVKRWDMGLGIRIEDGNEIRDVLVENSTNSPERIKLAAGIAHFETTNLFVETVKAYYNFILMYDDLPNNLLIKVDAAKASITKTKVENNPDVQNRIDRKNPTDSLIYYTEKIRDLENDFTNIGLVSQKMLFYISGLYVVDDYLIFKVIIKNEGNISFDIGFVGFFRGDKKGNKKRPRQEELLTPLYISNEEKEVIKSGEMIVKVYAFKKFTLRKNQHLYIQFWEGEPGERKAELVLRSKDILAAKALP